MNEYPPEVDLLLPPVIHPNDDMGGPFSHVSHHNRLRDIAGDHEMRIHDLERTVRKLVIVALGLAGVSGATFFWVLGQS